MTQQIKVFCDVCEKECQPQDGKATFGGVISRMNANLEKQPYQFMQDFCHECSVVILNFIGELRKDVQARGTNQQVERGGKGDAGKK